MSLLQTMLFAVSRLPASTRSLSCQSALVTWKLIRDRSPYAVRPSSSTYVSGVASRVGASHTRGSAPSAGARARRQARAVEPVVYRGPYEYSVPGASVKLETVPLKYAGLRYDEIWISEAQERMVLAAAEFRQYSTYRLAILAGVTTQSVFGFIRVSVLFGAISSAGGTLVGYNQQLASTYVWLGQALLAPIALYACIDIAERVSSGEIAVDFAAEHGPSACGSLKP